MYMNMCMHMHMHMDMDMCMCMYMDMHVAKVTVALACPLSEAPSLSPHYGSSITVRCTVHFRHLVLDV